MTLKFHKMHGLGNDFVIVDNRLGQHGFTAERIREIADRRFGVGCDQFIVMEPRQQQTADIFMRIHNPDGSEAGACGNGTRCVADLLMRESGKDSCVIETVSGLLACRVAEGGMVEVDMGAPRLNWDQIPLSEDRDTLHLGIGDGDALSDPVAVSMGNPHCVFFVKNVEKFPVETLGPSVERHALFPQKTNVEFAEILSPSKIRMRVWERGTGVTQACGSGACATMVAAARRGLTGRKAEIILDGGSLFLEWREADDHVLMTGPVANVFEGVLA
ncbi:MAG: diaminopimelate epimerase [Micavibrio sp.]